MVLFVNPLTPRMKPWGIQSFLTFDSMDRTLTCDHSSKAVEQCFTVVLFVNPSVDSQSETLGDTKFSNF